MTVAGYTLGRLLGRGGMSEVYAASHPTHGDALALKLLRVELTSDARVIAAFLGEAAQTRRIHHPNVVRIHDAGRDGDQCYVVMDRVDGEDLATRLRARTLTESEARTMFAAIADGMHAVHAAGIVHRDLKPANVMLRGSVPLIVDFGIAKSLGAQSALATGRRIGTPAYMAPEQLTGGLIAPCVDVWALGVMLFEAVTGSLPFDDFAEGRAPQLFETAPRALTRSSVSPALDHLIARCLERDPGKRARSMEAIARELRGEADVEAERVTQDAGALLPPPPGAFAPTDAPIASGPGGLAPPGALAPSRSGLAPPGALAPSRSGLAPPDALATPAPGALAPSRSELAPAPGALPPMVRARRWPWAVGATAVVALVAGALAMRNSGDAAASAAKTDTPVREMGSDPISRTTTPVREMGSDPISGQSDSAETGALVGAARQAVPAGTARAKASLVVEVRSQPAGAQILVGGRSVGVTPKRLDLAGPASLVVRHAGYRTANVRAERAGALDVRLVPLARKPRESLD